MFLDDTTKLIRLLQAQRQFDALQGVAEAAAKQAAEALDRLAVGFPPRVLYFVSVWLNSLINTLCRPGLNTMNRHSSGEGLNCTGAGREAFGRA